MKLLKTFIDKLQQAGYSQRDVRFFGVEDKLKRRVRKLKSINQFCKDNNMNQGTFYHMLSGKRPVPLDIMNKLGIEPNSYKCLISGSNISIKIPNELTPELAYLVGILRDGTIVVESKEEYTCAFYSKYKELTLTEVFGVYE